MQLREQWLQNRRFDIESRRGGGGPRGGPSGPTRPAAISDLAAPTGVTIGGTLTWTSAPGAVRDELFRDGVSVKTITSPYTIRGAQDGTTSDAGDLGAVLDVRGVNGAGTAPASNTLVFDPSAKPTPKSWASTRGTVVSVAGRISQVTDRFGLNNFVQATGSKQPLLVVGGAPDGVHDAISFDSSARRMTCAITGMTNTRTVYGIAWMPAPNLYVLDGLADNTAVVFSATGRLAAYAGAVGPAVGGIVAGEWVVFAARIAGTNSKIIVNGNIDTGVITAGAGGGSAGVTMGNAGASDVGYGGRITDLMVFGAAHSDADMADVSSYLMWLKANGATKRRIMVANDSIAVGFSGLLGGFRTGAIVHVDQSARFAIGVGPTLGYGYHRGVSGAKYQDIASGAGLTNFVADCITYLQSGDLLVLDGPTNDLGPIGVGGGGASTATVQGYATTIVNAAQAAVPGLKVLLMSVYGPFIGGVYAAAEPERLIYNAALAAFCAGLTSTTSLILADTYQLSDHIHPTGPTAAGTGYTDSAPVIGAAMISAGGY